MAGLNGIIDFFVYWKKVFGVSGCRSMKKVTPVVMIASTDA